MEAFGFGDGAPEVVARGKRRTVTYLAFITFAMYVASISNTDWVSGGLEFVLTSANTPPALPPAAFEAEIAAVAGAGGCGGGACGAGGAPLDLAALPKRLGAGASQLFHFTTTSTVVSRSTTFTWSGQELVYSCSYDLPCASPRASRSRASVCVWGGRGGGEVALAHGAAAGTVLHPARSAFVPVSRLWRSPCCSPPLDLSSSVAAQALCTPSTHHSSPPRPPRRRTHPLALHLQPT